jgi:hypothetical protein
LIDIDIIVMVMVMMMVMMMTVRHFFYNIQYAANKSLYQVVQILQYIRGYYNQGKRGGSSSSLAGCQPGALEVVGSNPTDPIFIMG